MRLYIKYNNLFDYNNIIIVYIHTDKSLTHDHHDSHFKILQNFGLYLVYCEYP